MKVCERFTIDEETLGEKAEDGGYWLSVETFYLQVKDDDVEMLSLKQFQWLERVELDLAKAEGLNIEV